MVENLVINKVSVEDKALVGDKEAFGILVEVLDTDTDDTTSYGIAVEKGAPLSHMEEVFKAFARRMQLLQFGEFEAIKDINNTNEED